MVIQMLFPNSWIELVINLIQQKSKSIHQYGSATQDESSIHFADQMDLYIQEEYKSTFFDIEDLSKNISKIYNVPY